tara:strand:- start:41 stop:409 length:369 start_codon:yes stop_codon:yes gene_type:complete
MIYLKYTCEQNPLPKIIQRLEKRTIVVFSPSPLLPSTTSNVLACWNSKSPIQLLEMVLKKIDVKIIFFEALPLLLEHNPLQRISAIKTLSLHHNCIVVFTVDTEKVAYEWMLHLSCQTHFHL